MDNNWNFIFNGLCHITGEPDSGKTTFALTVPDVHPSQMIFFDNDLKSQAIADGFARAGSPFGYFLNIDKMISDENIRKPVDIYRALDKHLDAAAEKVPEARVLIFDNFTASAESAIREYSLTIMPEISGLSRGQIENMSQLTWPYTYNVYSQFLGKMLSMANIVFIITHLREQYIGRTKTGLREARGQRPIIEHSSLRIWTRHNGDPADGGAPIGLVLKRLPRLELTETGLQPVSILPRRVKPLTWRKVLEYAAEPAGERNPTKDETPNPFELSILDGILTDDQKDALRVARMTMEAEEAEDFIPSSSGEFGGAPSIDSFEIEVKKLAESGKPPAVIAKELSERDGQKYEISEILEVIRRFM